MAIQAQGEGRVGTRDARGGRWLGGLVLIALGAFMLVGQILPGREIGVLFLPMLGFVFVAAALGSRNPGLLVPGGVLMGLGTGIYLLENGALTSVGLYVGGTGEAGVILLSLAAGFVLVTLLSVAIVRVQVWPLIPASILACIGGLLLWGEQGVLVLEQVGRYWPVALILFGLLLLVQRREA